jgi:nitroimidazol reductase NimA-like FMN-containing flavoprotein (pyridoxamine 5'-phosphate oxidase superfamily)
MTAEPIAPVLAEAALRAGHRELLETFGDFLAEIETGDPFQVAESARGAVAFLRQGMLPFARREEALYSPGGDVGEEVAFEHAFLAAEASALAEEAAVLAGGRSGEAEGVLARVRRRATRIQAVLELHVSKTEDRDLASSYVTGPAPAPVPAPAPPRKHGGGSMFAHRKMDGGEIEAFLRTRTWAVLSTVGGGVPYAVPVGFAFDGRSFYLATRPGRKLANLEENPVACLTVPDVVTGSDWRCVVASGPVSRVTGVAARVRGLELIRRKRGGAAPTARDLKKLLASVIFRMDAVEVSGRDVG